MTPPARAQAAIEILDQIIAAARDNGPPADRVLASWFQTRRFVGSKDRRAIRNLVWNVIRSHGDPPASGRLAVAADPELRTLFDGSGYGPAPLTEGEPVGVSSPLPQWFVDSAPDWLDAEEAEALIARAPLDIRVNPAKGNVASVLSAFPDSRPIAGLSHGMRLPETPTLEAHELFRSGAIEVQDAGSQHVARIAAAGPGETVIDLCAGAGGKTLALAADMKGEGRLIACDTDRTRLSKLGPRASRAGVTNLETRLLDPGREPQALADLAGQADLVLIDAPCTGSGTWRRSPDLRWRMSSDRAAKIEELQRHILGYAQQLVRPGGRLVYAVCSVRDLEGVDQFETLGDWEPITPEGVGRARGTGRLLTPFHDETDGFFIAASRKG